METFCLTAASEARKMNKLSDLIFQLAAGYFSVQKRRAFQGEVPAAILTAIRVGALTCKEMGLPEETHMPDALPIVLSTFSKITP